MQTDETVLYIENFRMELPIGNKYYPVVNDINLHVNKGEIVALVGESGCGKSMTATASIGLQPVKAKVTEGKIIANGRCTSSFTAKEWREFRGKEASMIFQEPMTALNPLMTVGRQIAESAIIHGCKKREAKSKALETMKLVGLPDTERLYKNFPHQLSGGMRQRIMIAMALINKPEILIADEPTTALDVTIQAQIMELIQKLNKETGTAVLLITHDLGIVRQVCNRVYIMYSGEIVESGNIEDVFSNPLHPYTKGLINSIPDSKRREERLTSIEGTVSPLNERPTDCCQFANRCRQCSAKCYKKDIPVEEPEKGHKVKCLNYKEEKAYGKKAI